METAKEHEGTERPVGARPIGPRATRKGFEDSKQISKEESEMEKGLTRMSRLLAAGGVASIVFGAVVLFWPGISLLALTSLFGAFAFVYGSFAVGTGLYLAAHKSSDWAPYVAGGLAGVIIGIITFLSPAVTDLTLVYLIGAWAFVIGVFQIVAAIDGWKELPGAAWVGVSGLLSVLFAIITAFRPGASMLAILWVIAFYAIAAGVSQVVAGYRIHQFQGKVKATVGQMQPTKA